MTTADEDVAMMRATIRAQKKVIDAQARLLVAYRTGSTRTAGAAIDALRTAREELAHHATPQAGEGR